MIRPAGEHHARRATCWRSARCGGGRAFDGPGGIYAVGTRRGNIWGEPSRPPGLGPVVTVDTSRPVEVARLAASLARALAAGEPGSGG